MRGQRWRNAQRQRFDRFTLSLGAATVALGVVAVLLSRRPRVPDLVGIDANTLEPLAHVALALILTLVSSMLLLSAGVRRAVVKGFFLGVSVTMAAEVAQAWLPTRSATVEDASLNVGGALLGAVVASALIRTPSIDARRVAAVGVIIGLVGGVWALQAEVPLGRSCAVEVIDVGPGTDLAPGTTLGSNAVLYDLSAAAPVDAFAVPESAGGPPLFGSEADSVAASPSGLLFSLDRDPGVLRSYEAGTAISSAALRTDTVAIKAIVTPSGDTLGPVLIAAISGGPTPSDMNVELGQHGSELSVRLRLGCGQFNWTRIADVFEPGVRREVVMSYAAGRQRVWVDQRLVDERVFAGESVNTVNWDLRMPLVVGNELSGGRQFLGEIELVEIGPVSR